MKKFKGELTGIAPHILINKNIDNEIGSFLLPLSLTYNDLKGLLLLDRTLREVYEEPTSQDGANPHLGEYNGIRLHIFRLLVGLVSEFFVYLRNNKSFIRSIKFKIIEEQLSADIKTDWEKILIIAFEDNTSDNSFIRKLARVRNNAIFHYNSQELTRAYIKKFFDTPKNIGNEKAYCSIGKSMESSRFYYADGVVEQFLNDQLQIGSIFDHQKTLLETVDRMNKVLLSFLTFYLVKNKKVKLK